MMELTLRISVALKSILHARMNLSPPLANAIFRRGTRFPRGCSQHPSREAFSPLSEMPNVVRGTRAPQNKNLRCRRRAGVGATWYSPRRRETFSG
jgi:hypothetical protein